MKILKTLGASDKAFARLEATAGWFDNMSPIAQKQYLKDHPNSKLSRGAKQPLGNTDTPARRAARGLPPLEDAIMRRKK